ncbi:MAG TPA: MIP/aquaporin family protein [Gemmatimonadaceae bacterium]|nr:MIP/aquaporin family protein [Gemmatimonadaceae bacterium]
MKDSIRHFVAEFVGTFALVFIGGGAIVLSKMQGTNVGLVEVALAHGIILAVMVTALMRISGHFNPAVTIAFLTTRRIGPFMAGVYVLAQLLGAMIAAYALKAGTPSELFEAARGGGQAVSLDINTGQAFMLEAIATFFLVFVIFGTAVDPKAPRVGGFAIGLTIAADILAIGPLTGASMNPARSFGPAIATNIWEGHLIYWIGPIVGAIVAAQIYEWVLMRHPVEPVEHGPVEPI